MKITQLLDNTQLAFPNIVRNSEDRRNITSIGAAYDPDVNGYSFYGKVKGSGNSYYEVWIVFLGAKTTDEIDLDKNDVLVSCQCKSYEFDAYHYNKEKGCHFSDVQSFPPYEKKTARPPLNKLGLPCLCKHLIAFYDRLLMDGWFN